MSINTDKQASHAGRVVCTEDDEGTIYNEYNVMYTEESR